MWVEYGSNQEHVIEISGNTGPGKRIPCIEIHLFHPIIPSGMNGNAQGLGRRPVPGIFGILDKGQELRIVI